MPYQPDELPLRNLDYQKLSSLVGQANGALGKYIGSLETLQNPEVMLPFLLNREATLSSKIEGTQVTASDVFEYEAGLIKEGEKGKDVQEVVNYRRALHDGEQHLGTYPIRLAFIRQLHRTLMNSVRGQDKTPGEFRTEQNWIGHAGCSIEQASFIPPDPLQLTGYLTSWENYLTYDGEDCLLQAAIVHAQFELLHPFKDGNGRIGRILIPLFLYEKKILPHPYFYLSEYLEEHRDEYYTRLKAISAEQDWTGWISFFLKAVAAQSETNKSHVNMIQELYEEMKIAIKDATRSKHTGQLLDYIFKFPVFSSTMLRYELAEKFGIPTSTTANLIRGMQSKNIVKELRSKSGRNPTIYYFPQLYQLLQR